MTDLDGRVMTNIPKQTKPMNDELTRIKRLDLVARTVVLRESPDRIYTYAALWLLLISVGETLFQKPWVGFSLVGCAAGTTALLWFRHRYGSIASAMTDFAMAAALFLLTTPSLQHIRPVLNYFVAIAFVWGGLRDYRQFFREQRKEWEIDRAQVECWLALLRRKGNAGNVVQIHERSFVRGYFTYRFLNTGDCWAVATFKIGKEDKFPATFRIKEPSAITLVREAGGTHTARVDGKAIPKKRAAVA
jgi:VanZ family protein